MPIPNKIEYLNKVKKECKELSEIYRKRYKKHKRLDDILDVITSLLNGSAIALTLSGFSMPMLLIGSIVCNSLSYIITQGQRSYNLKRRYLQNDTTYKQYIDLVRKIEAVLQKNHMTTDEYDQFIDQVHDRIALIDDNRLT